MYVSLDIKDQKIEELYNAYVDAKFKLLNALAKESPELTIEKTASGN